MKIFRLMAALWLCCAAFNGRAENLPSHKIYDTLYYQTDAGNDTMEVFTYETGSVMIGNDVATFRVPEGFKLLDQKQARYVLEHIWSNPPDESVLALLIPADRNPYQSECWAVCVQYEESGHVNDDDAKDINYDDLLKEMTESVEEDNKERESGGYRKAHLVGWAVPPYYDEANHKLHWAKELSFDGDSSNTLNYNIRALGRNGVLVMNVIAGMDQLPEVNKHVEPIMHNISFNDGNKYAQFDAGIDKVAAYGIGGLIAGKVLAKVGFFAILLKFWKLIALAVVGFFAAIRKKLFGKKQHNDSTFTEDPEAPQQP